MSASINDGCTLDATIPARGIWPAVAFRYRPALPDAVSDFLRTPKNGKQAFDILVAFLRKYVVSWDVVDKNGRAVDIGDKGEGFRTLAHPYIEAITEYVTGYNGDAAEVAEKN